MLLLVIFTKYFISNFLVIAQRQSLVYNSSYRKEAFICAQAKLAMIFGCIYGLFLL